MKQLSPADHVACCRDAAQAALALVRQTKGQRGGTLTFSGEAFRHLESCFDRAEAAFSAGDVAKAMELWRGSAGKASQLLNKRSWIPWRKWLISREVRKRVRQCESTARKAETQWIRKSLAEAGTRASLPQATAKGQPQKLRVVVLLEDLEHRLRLGAQTWPMVASYHPSEYVPQDLDFVCQPGNGLSVRPDHLHAVALAASAERQDFFMIVPGIEGGSGCPPGWLLGDGLYLGGVLFERYRATGKIPSPATGRIIRSFVDSPRYSGEPAPWSKMLGHVVVVSGQLLKFGKPHRLSQGAAADATLSSLFRSRSGRRSKRRTVFVFPGIFGVGGVERNTVELMRELRGDFRFIVITTERHSAIGGVLHHQLDGVADAVFDLAELASPREFLALFDTLRRAYHPDLVYICNGSPWMAANVAGLRRIFASVPMVDQQTYDDKEGWIALFEDPEKRPFDHFIATNNRIRDAYLTRFGIPDEKITVILSGINTEAFREVLPLEHEGVAGLRLRLSLPDRGRVFAFIGRLVEQKRPLDYLALARQAQKEGGDGTFVLVGQGKLQEDCAKFVEEHGLENVRLLEHCEFPLHLFSLVDGLILTSAYEGLPLVAQEAMCLGIPVLATDVGEIVPVFAKYQVGRLFRDSPDEASRYEDFRSWSQQIDLEKARSAAPVCRIQEDFSSKRVALEYRNCWEQAIQRHAAGRETQGAALTVIIPTYNRASLLEKTVRRCLDCAGEVRLEILVVDDGSTDTTAEVMSRLMEEEGGAVRYLRLSNGGPARARNAGADQAAHPVLLFMGDDVWPTNQDFFSAHALLHKANPAEDFAVLGKMEWPADPEMPVNFVMAHIQGEGGEQFAYDRIEPFSKVDWRYFYTSNVSVKKGLVGDWLKEGFSRDFPHAAFEDSEFAWRLRKQGRELDLRYCPTSVGAHLHAYNAEQFMRRQYLCGKMAVIFARMHPEVADGVGLVELKAALHKDSEGASAADPAHYAAVVQGLRSYLVLLESRADWGAYPWHRALLSAVFELAYFQGYLEGVDQPGLNQQNAYAWMLQRFASRLRKSANDRVVQDFIMGTLMSGPSK